jgi:hypothetical protein
MLAERVEQRHVLWLLDSFLREAPENRLPENTRGPDKLVGTRKRSGSCLIVFSGAVFSYVPQVFARGLAFRLLIVWTRRSLRITNNMRKTTTRKSTPKRPPPVPDWADADGSFAEYKRELGSCTHTLRPQREGAPASRGSYRASDSVQPLKIKMRGKGNFGYQGICLGQISRVPLGYGGIIRT